MWQSATLGNSSRDKSNSSSGSGSGSSSVNPLITVTYRSPGMSQPVTDAAVYIFHVPTASPELLGPSVELAIRAELDDYLGVLRASGGILLILTPRLLPEPGGLPNPEAEAVARARDLSMLQLTNDSEMEMTELLNIIKTVRDSAGKLVVTNHLRSNNGVIVAITIKYRNY